MRRSLAASLLLLACAGKPATSPTAALPPATPSPAEPAPPTRAPPEVREAPPEAFARKDPDRRARLVAAAPAVHEAVARVVASDRLVGVAVGVVLDGELVLSEGFGRRHADDGGAVDGRTVFRVGSITKLFTMTAALRLAERGRLDLDAPAAAALPELARLVHPAPGLRPISVRDILTHTAGLPRDPDVPPLAVDRVVTRDELLRAIDGLSLTRPPGLVHDYSNLGFSLLGHVVAAAAGRPYRDEIRAAVLEPLGMRDTVWQRADVPPDRLALGHGVQDGQPAARPPTRHGDIDAAGGLFSTVEDLARFLALQLDAWPPRGGPEPGPLARATLRESHTLHAHQSSRARTDASGVTGGETGVGLTWRVTHGCDHPHAVGHSGAVDGYHATLRFFPHTGVGVVVLANAAWADTEHITDEIQRQLARGRVLEARAPRPAPALAEHAARLVDLLAAWDPAAFAEHAALALREPPALARLGEHARWLHAALGRCTVGPAIKRATSAWSGVYPLQCERGDAELTLAVTTARAPKLASFSVAWLRGAADPAVEQAAAAALALLAAPADAAPADAAYHALFSPLVRRTTFDRTAAAVRHEHGACRLGPALEVTARDAATFALTCDRGAARLSLALDRGRPPHVAAFHVQTTGAPACR